MNANGTSDRSAADDPTRAGWLTCRRPSAEGIVGPNWRPTHCYALVDAGPKRRARNGRLAPGARLTDQLGRRSEAFYGLRYDLTRSLSAGDLSAADARDRITSAEFDGELFVAASHGKAVESVASLLIHEIGGHCDGGTDEVLWITLGLD